MPATLKPGSTFNLNIEMIPHSCLCLKCQVFLSLTTYSELAEKNDWDRKAPILDVHFQARGVGQSPFGIG